MFVVTAMLACYASERDRRFTVNFACACVERAVAGRHGVRDGASVLPADRLPMGNRRGVREEDVGKRFSN
jgi:hypothetical protein